MTSPSSPNIRPSCGFPFAFAGLGGSASSAATAVDFTWQGAAPLSNVLFPGAADALDAAAAGGAPCKPLMAFMNSNRSRSCCSSSPSSSTSDAASDSHPSLSFEFEDGTDDIRMRSSRLMVVAAFWVGGARSAGWLDSPYTDCWGTTSSVASTSAMNASKGSTSSSSSSSPPSLLASTSLSAGCNTVTLSSGVKCGA
jgi:hypothetical protein